MDNVSLSYGVVVIGRNEGERLKRCLVSVTTHARQVVYVDSGSTDGSVAMAGDLGIDVVELDMFIPFTAARARNEGYQRLLTLDASIDYVQFVDGDCEVVGGWMDKAASFLGQHDQVAVVCGRRRERYPDRSVYNMMCDIEWDTPIGEARSCGGDAMMRVAAFGIVGGFRPDLIAGEEPELCVRLRQAGWKIHRLDAEMTLHDAAMTRFGQWWKRSVRSGHAFAEGAYLHGNSPARHRLSESIRAWIWGLAIPLLVVGAAAVIGPESLIMLLVYPLQIFRLASRGQRSVRENMWRAFFLVLGKFPEVQGQIQFHGNRLVRGESRLIEYK